ncbi:MAG: hypothetical protein H6577_22825 [Lewinellaceae bacterium]|nr:hypothetical protein [Saprospiraceae bacterium]MCB9340970.1 hypothetical protein [Lewinellaceae bacterium]
MHDNEHDHRQITQTGKGDILLAALEQMLESREKMHGEVIQQRQYLESLVKELYLHDIADEDAEWSEKMLAPLAEVENTIAYFRAARQLANWYKKGHSLQAILGEKVGLKKLAGLGMRLRQRIEEVAQASEDGEGRIDARALNGRFAKTIVEAIRQMNQAGLKVYVDKVGNLHGILFPAQVDTTNGVGKEMKAHTQRAICICSHLDTVNDAGKYDGRLGVLSGIEVAHVLSDLKEYFNLQFPNTNKGALPHLLMVTAFNGEEMYFTGEGVSMPGSAAVAGRSTVEQIHKMTNLKGEVFKDKLVELLRLIQEKQVEGGLQLVNDFAACTTGDGLLECCFDPTDFFTRHTYERHIEQGPVLDEREIPLALVDTVMGIHQEDFTIEGIRAEQGALDINLKLRQLAREFDENMRITVGVMDSSAGYRTPKEVGFALRCQLIGEKNHAGATRYEDRCDAGVAAARLARHFLQTVEDWNAGNGTEYLPLIGGIELLPGTNRNVIPESAAFTLAINSPSIPEALEDNLNYGLRGWIMGNLTLKVKNGGEGIHDFSMEPIGFISASNQIKFSIDLRAASSEAIHIFIKEARVAINEVAVELGLKITSAIQQELMPYHLADSGQVLQLERSFGGSHNPNEAQLEADLLRGTLLQLNVVREFLQLGSLEHFNLFEFVEKHIPPDWKYNVRPFVSGALHDTCNIAGKRESPRVERMTAN